MKLSGVRLSICPFTASFAYYTPSWQVRCCGLVGQEIQEQMQARRQGGGGALGAYAPPNK